MTLPFFEPIPGALPDRVAPTSPAGPSQVTPEPSAMVHRSQVTRRDNHVRDTTSGRYLKGDRKR